MKYRKLAELLCVATGYRLNTICQCVVSVVSRKFKGE